MVACYPDGGDYRWMCPDEDDDWVGEPPEGRYTRDRAKPEFWQRPWPWAWAGTLILIVIVVVVVIVTR